MHSLMLGIRDSDACQVMKHPLVVNETDKESEERRPKRQDSMDLILGGALKQDHKY